jgi:HK97 family phage major capsid protein
MEEKDFNALVEKLGVEAKAKITTLFEEAEKGNKTAITELKAEFAKIAEVEGKKLPEYLKALQDHTNALEAQLKEFKTTPAKPQTFDAMLAKDVEANIEPMRKAYKGGTAIEIKAVGDVTITDNLGAGVVQPLYLQGVTGVMKRTPALYDLLNKIPWAGDTVHYVENSGGEGTIASRVESATSLTTNRDAYSRFPQVDYDFVKRTMSLSKIPVKAKVSEEMLENASNVVSFIKNEIITDLMLKLDTDILKGDGGSTIGTMKGLQHSDNYTAAAIPGNFTMPSGITPTNIHVLRAIVTQSYNLYMRPTAILLNPTDAMAMDLAVDKNGQFLLPAFASRDNTMIKGVPVYEMPGITAGTFHVIDGTKIGLYIQRGVNLKTFDQNGTDAEYDLKTLIASVKAGVLVKNNHKGANIYGSSFATLIAAMTAGS